MNDVDTIKIVSLALEAAMMRETAIARNVANIHTKNYHSLKVNFEEQLRASDRPNAVHPFLEQTGEPPALDEQMALSVQNATHYRALIKGLNHHLALMKMAMHGNNQS